VGRLSARARALCCVRLLPPPLFLACLVKKNFVLFFLSRSSENVHEVSSVAGHAVHESSSSASVASSVHSGLNGSTDSLRRSRTPLSLGYLDELGFFVNDSDEVFRDMCMPKRNHLLFILFFFVFFFLFFCRLGANPGADQVSSYIVVERVQCQRERPSRCPSAS